MKNKDIKIIISIMALIFFICAQFMLSVFYLNEEAKVFGTFGTSSERIFVDILLFSAIILQIVLIVLIKKREKTKSKDVKIIISIVNLILFVCAHFMLAIYYLNEDVVVFGTFGISIERIFIDILIFNAVILQIILIVLIAREVKNNGKNIEIKYILLEV